MPSETNSASATSPVRSISPDRGNCEGVDAKTPSSAANAPSFDPTEYVQKQRVTKTTPPKPAYNPLQFIQIKPCNLYQSAQDQLRKAEEVRKSKITKKEEAEDWQGNLDSWKSTRRKRVEHIIERVVEVKKLEIEEHDRTRKKSKTFSEMMEERGTGGRRKISLPVYAEDESNDLSDLGIGTSSASGKSSMSEDFDNHSVISDNPDTEKSSDVDPHERTTRPQNGNASSACRENVSSPGYETSSTAPTTSPDPSEYPTFGYNKQRSGSSHKITSKEATPEPKFIAKRPSVTKIEDRLVNFELKSSTSENIDNAASEQAKKDLPKVDITKRRQMFERETTPDANNRSSGDFSQATPMISIKERLCNLEKQREEANSAPAVTVNRLSGDITSIKDRLKNLEKETSQANNATPKIDVPLGGSIKDRLSSLHSCVSTTTSVTVPGDVAEVVEAVASPKSVVVVGMAKKASAGPSAPEQVIEVETLKIEIEQLQLGPPSLNNNSILATAPQPESLVSVMDSIQDAGQEYVTIEQHVKVTSIRDKEEYREITDEDLFGGTDIEIDGDIEIDNLQQDMSVLEALDIAFEAIDKDPVPKQEPECTAHNLSPNDAAGVATTATFAVAAEAATNTVCAMDDASSNPATLDVNRDIQQLTSGLITQANEERQEAASRQTAVIKSEVDEHIQLDTGSDPIYEVVEDLSQPKPLKSALKSSSKKKKEKPVEKATQNIEPDYDQVPLRNPIPLYENVEMFFANEALPTISTGMNLEPPKMKPPPPPVESEVESDEDEQLDERSADEPENETPEENLRRMNSTKRIKKDIRNKRSSFLGIQSNQNDDDLELKLSLAPPPDMSALIEEERRLEKQFLRTYDGIVERSDSGLSESHSRQSSEPFTGSSEDAQEDRSKELEDDVTPDCGPRQWTDELRMQNIEEQIREQEEVLRVERELLQIEQEELKRQRTNLLLRENYARKELSNNIPSSRHSLQDPDLEQGPPIAHLNLQASSSTSSTTSSTMNVNSPVTFSMQPNNMDYRQSMPDLQSSGLVEPGNPSFGRFPNSHVGVTPPAKPSRLLGFSNSTSTASGLNNYQDQTYFGGNGNNKTATSNDYLCGDFVQLRDTSNRSQVQNQQIGNMSRHTLHALSAVPKPKLTDVWVQQQAFGRQSEGGMSMANSNKYFPIQRKAPITPTERMNGEPWIARKSDAPRGNGYGKHWLIQEAEQRRLDQERGVRPPPNPQNWPIKSAGHLHRKSMPDISGEKKPLPDAVINTITQRLQTRMSVGNVVDRRRFDANPAVVNSSSAGATGDENNPMAVLSVSGKKKCSHCDEELGRGAAMIVESLRLFYHIDCFKCCVCLVRLGDGLNGTDVRVRNHKLHCQNCYSSDDGIKFSCV